MLKENLEQSREHYRNWWDRRGVVVASWVAPLHPEASHEDSGGLPPESVYRNPKERALLLDEDIRRRVFEADILPIADTDIGPGSLAIQLGAKPCFSSETIWFAPCWKTLDDPTEAPPLRFDPEQEWVKITEETLRESVRLAKGDYLTGCPDLVENIDTLASLREPQLLMMDMLEEPDWVEQKVREITDVWFETYQRTYDIIRDDQGWAAFSAFRIWGPGKTAKLQCDASAMFSPAMYERFVVPELTRQCEWLDCSMYHLDGTQAVAHLDSLLAVDALDAIEWTPQAGIESGGHERWFPLYNKILEAGKSLQIVNVLSHEVRPLLKAIGTEGVYVQVIIKDAQEVREILI